MPPAQIVRVCLLRVSDIAPRGHVTPTSFTAGLSLSTAA